ncbi:GNAT family N-acetyltransferase [Cellulomonas oligotrophica]|uniref:GNAT family N-acetyltransferase n=1 Tax=Cellulomonas oligotrophica TaxID=931536 RepID=A0ABQ4DAK5_9CELL|nr:GNAT family N-acetyltransferase [Cellulomonas oligotrophica]
MVQVTPIDARTARPWTVRPAPPVPDTLDHPDVWAYAGLTEVSRRSTAAVWGWTDTWAPLPVRLPMLRPSPYGETAVWVAVEGDGRSADDVVGFASVYLPLTANETTAIHGVVVDPRHEGRGIGAALLAQVHDHAAAHGRTVLQAFSPHAPEPPAGPDALEPPTGSGRVPRHDRAVRLAQRHGYVLEQVARASVLELPGDAAGRARLRDEARARAGEEYRTHTWLDDLPADRLDDLALLWTRMSTDAPHGAVEQAEDPWDADRVREHLERLRVSHQHVLMTVAEHVASGRLVAFSWLQVPTAPVPFAFQEDTLVLREHRGHALGMLVKTVNLDAFTAMRPDALRIHTWNAQENAHMLAINVAMGFRPSGVSAVWQRTTPA